MKILPVLLFFLACSPGLPLLAQQGQLRVRIMNDRKEPVPLASLDLRDRFDSTKVYRQVSTENGTALFAGLPFGQYLLLVTAVGHEPLEKGVVVNASELELDAVLEPRGKTMAGVVVRTQRPLMRQEEDKTIVDPEPLAASSTSGFEVLEKTPGLFIDQDGNIYISSLTPAAIQINGREMKMSASDIATLLKSLPPSAITRIEIVRQPSAKYDASGSGGVVNVVLKKGVRLGMTGSVNGGFQQGDYGNQFLGFSLNNNEGEKSSFIHLNVSRRNSFERIRTDRIFAPDSLLSQDAVTLYSSANYFANLGHAWSPSKKWDWDYSGSISLSDFTNKTRNPTVFRRISTGETFSQIHNEVLNTGHTLNVRNGVTLTHRIDSTGSEWRNDVFHNYTGYSSDQNYSATVSDPAAVQAGDGSINNHRHYIAFTSDLSLKLPGKFVFETGGKSGWLWFSSRARYFRISSAGTRDKDAGRTNSYDYDENINALYVQGAKTMGRDFVAKFGLRMENTNMMGRQTVPGDTSFSLHRTDLFPYIYLSKNIMKLFGYDFRAYLIYRRTISRPVYEQLNPFPRYVDQFLSEAGNPTLRPQFTQNYEANISVDERPILAVGVNETRDIFTSVVYQADTSRSQAIRTFDNLGKNTEWYLRGLAAIPPGGTYFAVVVAQYNHNHYRGTYEKLPLMFKKGTWTFFTYHQLKLGKLSQFTLHGFLRLKGQQQFYELGSFGSLTASITRQFFKQKLVATLSVNDIFYTQPFDFRLKQGTVEASGERLNDSRRFGINLRYNFGMRKKEEPARPDLNSFPVN